MRRLIIITFICLTSVTLYGKVYITIAINSGDRIMYSVSEIDSLSMIEPVPKYVKDIDGVSYGVSAIGEHYWMTENLRVMRYDTLSILRGVELTTAIDSTYFPYALNSDDGGTLYNWSAAASIKDSADALSHVTAQIGRIQGICPNKFHLPNASELSDLAGSAGRSGSNPLRSSDGWSQEPEQLYQQGTNDAGFNALPEGYVKGDEQKDETLLAAFWSADALSAYSALSCQMSYTGSLSNSSESKMLGRSVRCVWDGQTDRDWLYVYKPDTVMRYKVADINEISIFDDTDDESARLRDTNANSYKIKRYGTTYWMQENLRSTTGINQWNIGKETYSDYYIIGESCEGVKGVYYSLAAAFYMNVYAASGCFENHHMNSLKQKIKGICPDGWRLPQSSDVRELWESGNEISISEDKSSAIYFNNNVFAYGKESMFWVSDIVSGYKMIDGEKVNFLWGIPYVDNFSEEYKGRHAFLDVNNGIPALPCRCVRDLTEPEIVCRSMRASNTENFGIWENNYPKIEFGKDNSGDNTMKVSVSDEYFDAIWFTEE